MTGTNEGNGKQRRRALHRAVSKLDAGCWTCNVEVREGLSLKWSLPGLQSHRAFAAASDCRTQGHHWRLRLHHVRGMVPFFLSLRENGEENCHFHLQKFYLSKFTCKDIYQRDGIISEKYSNIGETKMALPNSIFFSGSNERLPMLSVFARRWPPSELPTFPTRPSSLRFGSVGLLFKPVFLSDYFNNILDISLTLPLHKVLPLSEYPWL